MKSFLFILFVSLSSAAVIYSCSKSSDSTTAASADTGKGGSLAKFTISGNYLYTVDSHYLYAYDLSDPTKPKKVYTSGLNYDIETIYPYKDNLFLGTKTGLYIYSISNPAQPVLAGEAKHARSCDPVVANDTVAFVTLKSTSGCGPATAGLYIHDIRNLFKPVLIKTIEMKDPVGLGLQDSILYVCCGTNGLNVFNVKDPASPIALGTLKDASYTDVIPYNQLLICFISDGILLYDISKPSGPRMIKKIT